MSKTKPTTSPLDVKMVKNDSGKKSVRGYFIALLEELWAEGEGFSGKRPFGNSCWEHEVYRAWVESGHLAGSTDPDGYLEDYDSEAADKLVKQCLTELYAGAK
jgi:hypothetical protein